eukprot:1154241-Pelagomonas_calceolata.AAC.3
MQVHTHNEQDCTLNKNDHTAAVNVKHCPHKLSMMHTICNTSLGAVHALHTYRFDHKAAATKQG